MTYQNDPNRPERLRSSYTPESSWAPMVALALVVAIVVVLIATLYQGGDTQRVTENAPRAERPTTPATPPAAKPEPNPAPAPPQ